MRGKDNKLPGTWQSATIGELIGANGVFVDGDWVESKDQDQNGDIRLIQLADIGDGFFRDKSSRFLTKNRAYELRCTFLQNGDILIARMPDPLGRACIFPLIGEEKYVTVVDVCIVRLGHNEISNRYLTYAINSPQTRYKIDKYKTGSTRKRISRKNLARVGLPIAPLPEQHRIVAKIEQLFSALDKGVAELKAAKKKLELYRQSLLKAAFEGRLTEQWRKEHAGELESAEELLARIKAEREKRYQKQLDEWKQAVKKWEADGKPGKKPKKPRKPKELPPLTEEELAELPELPSGWGWGYLQWAGDIETGTTPPKKHPEYYGSKFPFFKPTDLEAGYEVTKAREYLSSKGIKYARLLPVDSTLVTSIGATIGKTGIIRCTGASNQQINAIIPFDYFNPNYVYWQTVAPIFQKELKQQASSTTMPIINKSKFALLHFAFCSKSEQDKITQLLENAFAYINHLSQTIDQSLARAELLRRSILKKAFSGKLVPQDPNDEPASELLKRIKAEREAEAKKKKPVRKLRKKKEGKQVRDLLSALKKAGDWISAQDAFRQCGISDGAETDQIEPLYMELRDLVHSGKVLVERRGEEDWLKLKDTKES